MDNQKIAKELVAVARDLTASHPIDRIEKELRSLVQDIQNGNESVVDSRSLESMTDGEILGEFLNPILQSVAIRLKDMRGFRKRMKL